MSNHTLLLHALLIFSEIEMDFLLLYASLDQHIDFSSAWMNNLRVARELKINGTGFVLGVLAVLVE